MKRNRILLILDHPNEQTYDHLQIEINCQVIESRTELLYIIKAKSLKCQIGEYYVNGRCQTCESKFGYYSVKYNATKCVIFDKEKYSDITSNMIKMHQDFGDQIIYQIMLSLVLRIINFAIEVGRWVIIHVKKFILVLCVKNVIFIILGDLVSMLKINGIYNVYNIISFIIAIWAFASIFLSLKSIHSFNLLYVQLMIGQRYKKLLFKLNQNHESILIKMLLNYLWIFSVIFTFNLDFSFSFLFIEQTSDSSYFMSQDLDLLCILYLIDTKCISENIDNDNFDCDVIQYDNYSIVFVFTISQTKI
ncbi:unnamed protein product (macronuclear) [Paramecium tetraurelia]|uniref:Transmembrane protein n=1 Tax=Paramecium tetraurelia TaxID=5888 RepID=A0EFN1_PARTE|nr:uncharacterized protein GSPATT00026445001 [Paramecium tetraurelia]CAK94122.1 unnamed protein product [Paramecium tetraurelia]|eukprot:XP_001461495.1 hypothetical protein (macronuclear) [Paramecium tetraurelia strain d4-2]